MIKIYIFYLKMHQRFEQFIIKESPKNLNYGLIEITSESKYSSLMPWHIEQVSNLIKLETKNIKVNKIVDCNAHIGVDTILFRLLFPNTNITAIELNELTYSILINNINNINLITNQTNKSIEPLNIDCLDYIFYNEVDIMYFDPPWGGPNYNEIADINLYLSGYELTEIISDVFLVYNCLIIIKLPRNIDIYNYKQKFNNHYFKTYNIYTKNNKISYILAFIKKLEIVH
jgi:predicted RNA methylase